MEHESALPGTPMGAWRSRAEMMRARGNAVERLERAASHDWRRLATGTFSLVLVLSGQLLLLAVLEAVGDAGWEPLAAPLVIAASVALTAGVLLGAWTWRRGRRTITALVMWEELTDRLRPDGSEVPPALREIEDAESGEERRQIRRRNWVLFRTRVITFPRIGRAIVAAAAFLLGGGTSVGVVGSAVDRGDLTYSGAAALLLGLTVFLYGCVLYGGQQRFANVMIRRELRMRRLDRRITREERERRAA